MKIGIKNKHSEQKIVTKIVNINPTIPVIILNINGLNVPVKRQVVRLDQKT